MSPGLLVTFEGGEGAGKSTQIARLTQRARLRGLEVLTCREPGGTPLGERLREALFGLDAAPTALAELLTFAAARAELVATLIRPALERGQLVLCDRFTDSTVAYQGYGRGLDLGTIEAVNAAATGGLVPDLTLLLDLDPAAGRARGAEGGTDYLERETIAFHERVRDGFLALADRDPTRWRVIDAAGDIDTVSAAAWAPIEALLTAAPA
ncbi:MAG: dTMP kinase [Dehalococcoidia bacterium]